MLAFPGIVSGCENPFANDHDDDEFGCLRAREEFATSGCFEVTGTVVRADGLPLVRAVVGPHYVSEALGFNTEYVRTDSAGHFRFRGTRRMVGGPPAGQLDTVSLYVIATDMTPFGDDDTYIGPTPPVLVTDSVMATVTVFPDGRRPSATTVQIRLPVP